MSKVCVKDKDGNVHEMTELNAIDKVRFDGWKMVGTVTIPTPESQVINASAGAPADPGADAGEAGSPTLDTEAEKALAHLDERRKEAMRLGVQVDMRWGLRKLNEKIAVATAAAGVTPSVDLTAHDDSEFEGLPQRSESGAQAPASPQE